MSVIHKLDPITINRIAAGEVVQRPSAAIKELVENSIDAGSKVITVTVKNGGLDMLQIQDDGCGIRKEDLGIVCERFTTSKLSNFEDLKSISTFGFRGEALASITHVAKVTITTKTASSPCAYKGKYCDGKLVPMKHGDSADPRPCAGVNGTTITVEDLFYNMKTRRTAFKNTSEQYQRILDVVTRYAIHYGDDHIGFTCRKQGQSIPDVHTPSNASTTIDNIKIAFGSSLTRELLKCEFSFTFDQLEGQNSNPTHNNVGVCTFEPLTCNVKGYVSNANYSTKRSTFIFFINHRLVDCSALKKMLDSFYADILPKTGYPFVYLSIAIPPQIVDVNIHPTKKEVCFLYESQLLQEMYGQMRGLLSSANESRAFVTRSVLPTVGTPFQLDALRRSDPKTYAPGHALPSSQDDENIITPDMSTTTSSRNVQRKGGIPVRSDILEAIGDDFEEQEHVKNEVYNDATPPDPNTRDIFSSFQSTSRNISSDRSSSGAVSTGSYTSKPRGSSCSTGGGKNAVTAPNKLVRTDPTISRINQFFPNVISKNPTSAHDDSSDEVCVEDLDNIVADTIVSLDVDMPLLTKTLDFDDGRSRKRLKKNRSNVPLCMPVGSCMCCVVHTSATLNESSPNHPIPLAGAAAPAVMRQLQPIEDTACQYLSIVGLIADIRANFHSGVDNMLKKITFVGIVNSVYMLGQVDTKLLLVDYSLLTRHLFYQLVVRRFGEIPAFELKNPILIRDYVMEALYLKENEWSEEDGDMNDICAAVIKLFLEKRELLKEYFSIEISTDGTNLMAMPDLLNGYMPCPCYLPTFLLRLATAVDWENENNCFQDVSQELSILFSRFELEDDIADDDTISSRSSVLSKNSRDILQNLFIPAFKQLLIPQRSFALNGTSVIELTSLEKLYKIFERC